MSNGQNVATFTQRHLALIIAALLIFFAVLRVYIWTGFNSEKTLIILSIVDRTQLLVNTFFETLILSCMGFTIAFISLRKKIFEQSEPITRTAMLISFILIAIVTLSTMTIITGVTFLILLIFGLYLERRYNRYDVAFDQRIASLKRSSQDVTNRLDRLDEMVSTPGFDIDAASDELGRIKEKDLHVGREIDAILTRSGKLVNTLTAILALLISLSILASSIFPWTATEALQTTSGEKYIGHYMGTQGDMTLLVTRDRALVWINSGSVESRQICVESGMRWFSRPLASVIQRPAPVC